MYLVVCEGGGAVIEISSSSLFKLNANLILGRHRLAEGALPTILQTNIQPANE